MDSDAVSDLLGRHATDPVVEATLQRYGVARRPELAVDPDDVDGPVVESQDWVSNFSDGIEFGFQEEGAFMNLDQTDRGIGPMILTEVYFYADRPGVRACPHPLPFGLALADDRATVRARMDRTGFARRSHVRDTWDYPAFRMTVSYADDGARIDFVVCMLRSEPPEALEGVLSPPPALDAMLGVLGRATSDPAVRQVLVPLGLDRQVLTNMTAQWIDFRRTYGLRLHVRGPGPGASVVRGAIVIRQVEFLRAGELESRGWRGALPFDLSFDDAPEAAFRKIGRPPVRRDEQDFTGEAFWELPGVDLQVAYSTMENILLRVSAIESARAGDPMTLVH